MNAWGSLHNLAFYETTFLLNLNEEYCHARYCSSKVSRSLLEPKRLPLHRLHITMQVAIIVEYKLLTFSLASSLCMASDATVVSRHTSVAAIRGWYRMKSLAWSPTGAPLLSWNDAE